MKVGFQTIIWGPHVDNWAAVLDIVRDAGYQGVEIAQRPENLPRIDELGRMLKDRKLTFLGLAGGKLHERTAYCGADRSLHPNYLYIEDWSAVECRKALDLGFKLALHPHVFKPIHRFEDARKLLDEHPELLFLPDTAHLTIAGDDPIEAVRWNPRRIAAVHLKDWSREYGRSSHRYARGFTELGSGAVRNAEVIAELNRIGYSGWLVAEQDVSRTDPATSATNSANWLRKHARIELNPSGGAVRAKESDSPPTKPQSLDSLGFAESLLHAASQGGELFYRGAAQAFLKLLPCRLVAIWACSPSLKRMSLLALEQDGPPVSTAGLRCIETLGLEAIDRQIRDELDLTSGNRGSCHQALLRDGLTRMINLPIHNPSNAHHIRFMLNLIPKEGPVAFAEEDWLRFGREFALAADFALDDICTRASGSANLLAGDTTGSADFLKGVVPLVTRFVHCRAAAIFLVNDDQSKLLLGQTTGTEWNVPEDQRHYAKGEGLTGLTWSRKEPLVTSDPTREKGRLSKSIEPVDGGVWPHLFIPWTDAQGQVVAVVRCHKHLGSVHPDVGNLFSDDDVAVLDAIGQSVVPHLTVLLDKERRVKALSRLKHEMDRPVASIRSVVELMQDEFKHRKESETQFFGYDYLEDAWSWCELLRRLLDNASLIKFSPKTLQLEARSTLLFSQVIAPAVRQAGVLLKEKGLSPKAIDTKLSDFEGIPPLHIDRNQFQQVTFNLLSNAIKYGYKKSFQMTIDGFRRDREFVIRFRDWGPGIKPELRDAIFLEGVRGPDAVYKDVSGQGLGLYIVRMIVEAHGGRVSVTNLALPTEFSVFLPDSLEFRPPTR